MHARLCNPFETTEPSMQSRDRNQPTKIQQHKDKYGCIYSVQSVDLVGLPVSTPKPEVEIPFWNRSN